MYKINKRGPRMLPWGTPRQYKQSDVSQTDRNETKQHNFHQYHKFEALSEEFHGPPYRRFYAIINQHQH